MGETAGAWIEVPWNITLRGGKKYKKGVKFYETSDVMELLKCSGTRQLTKAQAKRARAIAEAEAMVDDAEAEFAASGEAGEEDEAEEKSEEPAPEPKPQPDELETLKKAQLIAIAKDRGVEVTKRMNVGEIIAAIRDAS